MVLGEILRVIVILVCLCFSVVNDSIFFFCLESNVEWFGFEDLSRWCVVKNV